MSDEVPCLRTYRTQIRYNVILRTWVHQRRIFVPNVNTFLRTMLSVRHVYKTTKMDLLAFRHDDMCQKARSQKKTAKNHGKVTLLSKNHGKQWFIAKPFNCLRTSTAFGAAIHKAKGAPIHVITPSQNITIKVYQPGSRPTPKQ